MDLRGDKFVDGVNFVVIGGEAFRQLGDLCLNLRSDHHLRPLHIFLYQLPTPPEYEGATCTDGFGASVFFINVSRSFRSRFEVFPAIDLVSRVFLNRRLHIGTCNFDILVLGDRNLHFFIFDDVRLCKRILVPEVSRNLGLYGAIAH